MLPACPGAKTMPIPRIFDHQPVVIVAGGPSLKGFDFDRLEGFNVIAINRSLEFLPTATVLWWSDAWFWRHYREKIILHKAQWKATCLTEYRQMDSIPETVTQYRFTGLTGFDPDIGCLRHGNNSAYAAMHLAVHLGASRIILLGVDMKYGDHGESHFHSGHGIMHKEKTLTHLMLPYFPTLAQPLADRSIHVFNASPNSALTVWPRGTIEEGLYLAELP
jgi:hypothetical protein